MLDFLSGKNQMMAHLPFPKNKDGMCMFAMKCAISYKFYNLNSHKYESYSYAFVHYMRFLNKEGTGINYSIPLPVQEDIITEKLKSEPLLCDYIVRRSSETDPSIVSEFSLLFNGSIKEAVQQAAKEGKEKADSVKKAAEKAAVEAVLQKEMQDKLKNFQCFFFEKTSG